MNDPRNVSENGQQYVDPELSADPDLKEYTQWGQDNGKDESDNVHDGQSYDCLFVCLVFPLEQSSPSRIFSATMNFSLETDYGSPTHLS